MYTGATFDSSGQFYSPQYESLKYLGGWKGVGRSISDRMSYRNHYMCSGEATSTYYFTGFMIRYTLFNFRYETFLTFHKLDA